MGVFNGLKPTLLGIVPYAGISFACFHTFKEEYKAHASVKLDTQIPVAVRLLAGALAGLIAQSATYPLDIVRRRMQVSNMTVGKVQMASYESIWHAVQTIQRNEGWQGLYKGLSMNWIKGPISVGISFTVNDLIKSQMRKHNEAKQLSVTSG